DLDAVHFELEVAFGGTAVEAEPVLEPRAPTALNGDAEDVDVFFLSHQLFDLAGRRLRDRHQRDDSLLKFHRALIVAIGPPFRALAEALVCNTRLRHR